MEDNKDNILYNISDIKCECDILKMIFEFLMENTILSFYHGSTVYGTLTEHSDTDIVCIVKNNMWDGWEYYYNNIFQYKDNNIEYQFIEENKWIEMIKNHHIIALEGLSLPDNFIIKGDIVTYRKLFKLDKWKLRQTVSAIAENAYAKCHKKLTVEKDYDLYRAKKSIFHSLRILDYGKQIAEFGRIVDYKSSNYLWDIIYNMKTTKWEDYKDRFKPLINKKRSEFVKLCPKPVN